MNLWFRSAITTLMRSHRHADCSFTIESGSVTKVFPSHKLIFSCASDVFDRILYLYGTGNVTLNDVTPETFEKFRDYIYTYDCVKLREYDFNTLLKLCEFGNKYLVDSIQEDCINELLRRMTTLNTGELLRLFQCAHTLNRTYLINTIVWDLKEHHSIMALSHSAVYEFSTDVFLEYLKVVAGKLSESARYNLIEMYLEFYGIEYTNPESSTNSAMELPASDANGNDSNHTEDATVVESTCNKFIKDLISLIDFSKFTHKEFYEGPGKSNLLTMQQKYEHLYLITKRYAQDMEELQVKISRTQQEIEGRRVVTVGNSLVREARLQVQQQRENTVEIPCSVPIREAFSISPDI